MDRRPGFNIEPQRTNGHACRVSLLNLKEPMDSLQGFIVDGEPQKTYGQLAGFHYWTSKNQWTASRVSLLMLNLKKPMDSLQGFIIEPQRTNGQPAGFHYWTSKNQ
jgi:hypothetical protein